MVATIRFQSAGVDVTVRVDVVAGAPRTLLSVARAHAVPVLFNCESGECGACAVRVEARAAAGRPIVPLTEPEKTFLSAAAGRLAVADEAAALGGDGVANVRLACQYAVGDEDITVSFESNLRGC